MNLKYQLKFKYNFITMLKYKQKKSSILMCDNEGQDTNEPSIRLVDQFYRTTNHSKNDPRMDYLFLIHLHKCDNTKINLKINQNIGVYKKELAIVTDAYAIEKHDLENYIFYFLFVPIHANCIIHFPLDK